MKTDILYKDRDEEIQKVCGALRLVGLNVEYEAASLIYVTMRVLNEKGSGFSLKDASKIQLDEEKKFETYFERKEESKSEINPTH
jgi:hypothetical protein